MLIDNINDYFTLIHLKLTYSINTGPGFIFEYLTDMQKFVTVHPVISKIDKTGNNTYLVYETLKFGFIPFPFNYPVAIEADSSQMKVKMKATVFKLTKIEMMFEITASGSGSLVNEEISFRSYLPVKFMMRRIFKKQHEQLFKNIEKFI